MPPRDPAPQTISVVIVNWNVSDELRGCLASIRANPPLRDYEVIVVDNASRDGSQEMVGASAPWVRLIANSTNRGLAAGNNQGIQAAHGEIIVIANPDVMFLRGTFDALVDVMERRPRAAFVFAQSKDDDGSIQASAGSLPTFWRAFLGRKRQKSGSGDPPFASILWDGWAHDREMPVGHGLEACYAVRRSAVEEIGPQDEHYVLDWEGIDWCARAVKAGWELWFSPEACVVHSGSRSIRQAPFRWVIQSHRGMYRYFAQRNSPLFRPVLALLVSVRAMLKVVAVAIGAGYYDRYVRDRPGA